MLGIDIHRSDIIYRKPGDNTNGKKKKYTLIPFYFVVIITSHPARLSINVKQ